MVSQVITLARPVRISGWDQLCKTYEDNKSTWDANGWLFRGQVLRKGAPNNRRHQLETSLEYVLNRFRIKLSDAVACEQYVLRDFKRRCTAFTGYRPPDNNDLEWLALLRHYGGPTRLLDWTYSFWLGVYFALENANQGDTCEIWALDAHWYLKQTGKMYPTLQAVLKEKESNSP